MVFLLSGQFHEFLLQKVVGKWVTKGQPAASCDNQFICFPKGLISLKQESMVMFLRVGKSLLMYDSCENCRDSEE